MIDNPDSRSVNRSSAEERFSSLHEDAYSSEKGNGLQSSRSVSTGKLAQNEPEFQIEVVRHRRPDNDGENHQYRNYQYRNYQYRRDDYDGEYNQYRHPYERSDRHRLSNSYDYRQYGDLSAPVEKPGFFSEAWHAGLRSLVQSPLDNAAQLVDNTVGKFLDTHLYDKTKELIVANNKADVEVGSAAWHGRMVGDVVGMLPWMLLANKVVRGSLGSFEASKGLISSGEALGQATFRQSFTEGALTGATYTGLFSSESDNENFWSSKAKHTALGAGMMGTFGAFNNGILQRMAERNLSGTASRMFAGALSALPGAAVETGLDHMLYERNTDLVSDFKVNLYKDALIGAGFNGLSRFENAADRVRAAEKVDLKPLEAPTTIAEMPEGSVGWTPSWALKTGPKNTLWISSDAVAGTEFNASPALSNTLRVIRTENGGIAVDMAKMADPSHAITWRNSSDPKGEGFLPVGLAMHPKGVFPFEGNQARLPAGYGENIKPDLTPRTFSDSRPAPADRAQSPGSSPPSSSSGWGLFEHFLFWNWISGGSSHIHNQTTYNLGGTDSSFTSNSDVAGAAPGTGLFGGWGADRSWGGDNAQQGTAGGDTTGQGWGATLGWGDSNGAQTFGGDDGYRSGGDDGYRGGGEQQFDQPAYDPPAYDPPAYDPAPDITSYDV